MVFARKSRSDEAAKNASGGSAPHLKNNGPTPSSLGRIVDPFAADQAFPDPASMAEKVVFKLWSDGAVKGRAIEQARREAGDKLRLDQALTRLRLANPELVASALAEQIQAPMAQERDFPATPVMMDELPSRFVREALALPLADDGETLVLAMADPLDDYALRAIAMKTRRRLAVKVACANRLEAEIFRLYPLTDMRGQRALPAPKRERAATEERAPAPMRPAAEARPRDGAAPVTPNFVRRRASPAPEAAPERRPQRRDVAIDRAEEARSARPARPPLSPSAPLEASAFSPRIAPQRASDDRPAPPRQAEARVSEELVEETARNLARDLELDRDHQFDDDPELDREPAPSEGPRESLGEAARPRAGERRAGAGRPTRRPESAPLGEQEPLDLVGEAAPVEPGGAMPRPKFIRPRRVTLKNKVERVSVPKRPADRPADRPVERADERIDEETSLRQAHPRAVEPGPVEPRPAESLPVEPRPAPMTTAPESAPEDVLAAAAPGAIAAKVREQVAARRAERERAAAEGRGIGPIPDDDFDALDDHKFAIPAPERQAEPPKAPAEDAPLRFGEIRGHAAAARAKTSPTRRRVLDQVRAALGLGAAKPEPAEDELVVERAAQEPVDRDSIRYQAASALEERAEKAPEIPALRLPKVETLKHFGTPKDRPAASASALAGGPRRAATAGEFGVAGLSVESAARAAVDEAKSVSDGLILVAGQSGSGKIETVRKFAEARAAGRVELQRFDKPGATFPRDSEFRVYWGEICDAESAEAAARAAMTGALVVATLDASNAAAAPGRLIALGLPPYALASSLRVVLAQRIEEKGCTRCAETGRGAAGSECAECGGQGRAESFRIGDAMRLDDAMRALILSDAPEDAYRHAIDAAAKKAETGAGAAPLAGRARARSGPPDALRL